MKKSHTERDLERLTKQYTMYDSDLRADARLEKEHEEFLKLRAQHERHLEEQKGRKPSKTYIPAALARARKRLGHGE